MKTKCSPTEQVYQSVKCHIIPAVHHAGEVVGKTVTTIHQAAPQPTLPFTGLDLLAVVFAGVVLIIMGVSLRRVTRAPR